MIGTPRRIWERWMIPTKPPPPPPAHPTQVKTPIASGSSLARTHKWVRYIHTHNTHIIPRSSVSWANSYLCLGDCWQGKLLSNILYIYIYNNDSIHFRRYPLKFPVRDCSDESRRPAEVLGLYTPDEPTPRPLPYYFPDNNVECRYRERERVRELLTILAKLRPWKSDKTAQIDRAHHMHSLRCH